MTVYVKKIWSSQVLTEGSFGKFHMRVKLNSPCSKSKYSGLPSNKMESDLVTPQNYACFSEMLSVGNVCLISFFPGFPKVYCQMEHAVVGYPPVALSSGQLLFRRLASTGDSAHLARLVNGGKIGGDN